nr:odorant receptor 18 [Achelura yunnanensis]
MSNFNLNSHLDNVIKKVNIFSRVVGIAVDDRDADATFSKRLQHHWVYVFHMIWLYSEIAGELVFLVRILTERRGLVEFTYVVPCIAECLLGTCKSYFVIKYAHHVHDIINTLKKVQTDVETEEFTEETKNFVNKTVLYLNKLVSFFFGFYSLLISSFGVGPLTITATKYFKHGVTQLELPFLISYPFNARDIRIWPFVFLHQLWAGNMAVMALMCSDLLYYVFCTYIFIQFHLLHKQLENLKVSMFLEEGMSSHFLKLVKRHKEIIRCVELVEVIYTKSTLLNMITSSLLICLTGFDVMVIKDLALLLPFLGFLSAGLMQIYFLCYYGDLIMRSSELISEALYNSQWYSGNIRIKKELILMMMRSQKPCRLTAFGFADVDLETYKKILSTSWSYFALLNTMYQK